MFEVIFLGTSASAPSVHRGLSAQVVKHNEHRFLIDCGEGTQRQILRSGLGFRRLNRVLITHGHLDHILGLGGLLSTYMRWEAIDKLEIIGGRSALERIHDLLYGVVLRRAQSPIEINLVPIEPGVFFENEDFSISAFAVEHRGPDCLGFVFEEKPRCPFLPERADALDIPPGPWRRDLVNGLAVTLPDGRLIQPDEVLGPERPGARLVFSGDVADTACLEQISAGADVLVCEATYLHEDAEMARQFSHLTARQAAELALKVGVKYLILTHLSRRYREKDILEEAAVIFPNVVVARDFDVFQIRRGVAVKVTLDTTGEAE